MFFNVLGHFQDNRKKIIILITVGVLIVFFIKAINNYTAKQRFNSSSNNTTAISKSVGVSNDIKIKNTTSKDGITSSNNIEVDEKSIKTADNVIEAFLLYCNNNQVDRAYNLLSDDCKKVLYPTQSDFYNNYYKSKMTGIKDYSYLKYGNDSNTYKLVIKNNTLATGKTSDGEDIVDYITVVFKEDNYKLNIGGFIKKESLNVKKSDAYLTMNVTERVIFMEYEEYTVNIKNTTLVNADICNANDDKGIYLLDKSSNKYYFKNDDYIQNDLLINYKSDKTIKLKFNRKYRKENEDIKSIVFPKINLTNREYYDNTVQYKDSNGNIEYEKKYTSYPNSINFSINLK